MKRAATHVKEDKGKEFDEIPEMKALKGLIHWAETGSFESGNEGK